jgi:succinate dehydrogenase hydrophobic membrane anchor protein
MAVQAKARGVLSWFFQRITAVLLVYFLGTHIVILHFIRKGTITFASVAEKFAANPVFYKIFYMVFIPSLLFHALNGAWSVFVDYNPSEKARKITAVIFWGIGLALTAFGYVAVNSLLGGAK